MKKGLGLFLILVVLGCSKGPLASTLNGNDKTAGGDCEKNGAVGTIENNHGHTLSIPASDVLISQAKSYDITGSAGHSHTVDVSVDSFNRLALRNPVSLVSSAGSPLNFQRLSSMGTRGMATLSTMLPST